MKQHVQPVGNDPVHLTATASIPSNSQGGVNALNLKNPNNLPMELLAIKWQLSARSDDGQQESAYFTGGAMSCKLDMGQIPLTNGYIPVWNFGATRTIAYEELLVSATDTVCQFRWELDHPLYIPAGAVVVPTFQHRGLIQPDIDVRISYACRTLPKDYVPPPKVKVPYVACYTSKVFDVLGAAEEEDQSLETDLINKFDQQLMIHRFVGRLNSFGQTTEGLTVPFNFEQAVYQNRLLTTRMMDLRGEPIVPRFTPFRQVFSPVTRSWEVRYPLDPKQFLIAYLQKAAVTGTPEEDFMFAQAFISMVGTREVAANG